MLSASQPPAASAPTYTINQSKLPSALTKYVQRWTGMLQGTQPSVRINAYGDSLTTGSQGPTPYTGSITEFVANRFRSLGYAVSHNHLGFIGATSSQTAYDPRYQSWSGTWGVWQNMPGGSGARATTASASQTWSASVAANTINVYYIQMTTGAGGGGDMTITVDGGATQFSTPSSGGNVSTQTINQSGSLAVVMVPVTIVGSLAAHTITITNGASNNIVMYGFEAYTSGVPTVFIRNFGYSGTTSTNWNGGSISLSWLYSTALVADLAIVGLGANDMYAPTALATYSTNLAAIQSAIASNVVTSQLWWTWPPVRQTDTQTVGGAALTWTLQQTFVDTFTAAAGTTIPVVDIWRRYVALGGQEALMPVGGYIDTIHLTAFYRQDVAARLFEAINPRNF